jgi:hypothetical protein
VLLQLVLHAGEVLFVPGNTPHAVENLSDALALAANFVDESNVEDVLREMRTLGLRDRALADAADALEEMDLPPDGGMDEAVGIPAAELVVPMRE